jgi:hypothetical protein
VGGGCLNSLAAALVVANKQWGLGLMKKTDIISIQDDVIF